MLVLGISNGHDANVSLVEDGAPIALFEKERFSRKKHASGRLGHLIGDLLVSAQVSRADIDLVAVVPPIWQELGFDWNLEAGRLPAGPADVAGGQVSLLGSPAKCVFVPHHLAHASYSFHSSGARDADVLTADAGGYFCDASLSTWRNRSLVSFRPVFGFNIGSLWSVAAREAFGDIFASGKVMGLAALGAPKWLSAIQQYYGREDTRFPRARSAFADPGLIQNAIGDWREKRTQDFGASLQEFTTHALIKLARTWQEHTQSATLCLGGGVALNGYANSHLARHGPYQGYYFPPAPNDGSLSLGAALYASSEFSSRTDSRELHNHSPFLGVSPRNAISDVAYPSDAKVKRIAEMVADGKVIGICSGRAETGPRALGHRSIVASPERAWITPYLNSSIKRREPFRPIAPAIRARDASELLSAPNS